MSAGWKSKFNVAKQWTQQKLGSAEESPEDPQFIEVLKNYSELRDGFKRLQDTAEAFYKANKALIAAGREMGIVLEQVGNDCGGACVNEFKAISKATQNSQDNLELANNSANAQLVVPVAQLVAKELGACSNLRSEYQNAKLNFDACSASVAQARNKGATGTKVAEAEKELDVAKNDLDSVKNRFTEAVQNIEKIRDGELHEAVKLYMPAQTKYFRHSLGDFREYEDG